MIEIGVVDVTAEARNRLARLVDGWLTSNSRDALLLPHVSIRTLLPEEVGFHGALDVCIIGPELTATDAAHVGVLRKALVSGTIICMLDHRTSSLGVVEQLARLGADDVINESTGADDFIRRLLFRTRRKVETKKGKSIVVDSAKGGVGVTSIVAGLGEALLEAHQRVCVVDWDTDTQDLSRFLQAKPFVNEGLQVIFDEQRSVTRESVEDCLVPVWQGVSSLKCLTPLVHPRDGDTRITRTWLSVSEVIESLFDWVLIDVAHMPAAMKVGAYQRAHAVLHVLSNDPCCVLASAERLGYIKGSLAPAARLMVMENALASHGLSPSELRRELEQLQPMVAGSILAQTVPFGRDASFWPASGMTIYSSDKRVRASLDAAATVLLGGTVQVNEPSVLTRASEIVLRAPRRWMERTRSAIPGENRSRTRRVEALPPPGVKALPERGSLISKATFQE